MSYLNFLILFVITPSVIMAIVFRKRLTRLWWGYIGLLSVIAVVWTTPWDNYLVANNVWWYDPSLVLGIKIWYVPIEEYSFFVLQTVMTGILLAGLMGRFAVKPLRPFPLFARVLPALPILTVVVLMLASGSPRYNYTILVLGWLGLIPLAVQWGFGLDILVQRWRMVLVAIAIPTLWLTMMDTIAISAGTWTIDPRQTIGIMLPGGVVPFEEGLFFTVTNILIVQGITLVSAPESRTRFANWSLQLARLLSTRRSELSEG